jgi:hypothetical protein
MMSPSISVRKRLVVYFSGFDPAGPSRYHKIYSQQAQFAAPLLQAKIQVGELVHDEDTHLSTWKINYEPSDESLTKEAHSSRHADTVETDYVFARWDDIARQHWPQLKRPSEILKFIGDFFAAHWLFIRSGAIYKITRLDSALGGMLLMPLFLALGASLLILISFAALLTDAVSQDFSTSGFFWGTSLGSFAKYSVGLTLAWILGMVLLDRHWHMLWVMRSYIFTSRHGSSLAPEIENRLDRLAVHIHQKMIEHKYAEILFVGHSTGSIMAKLTLSRIYEKLPSQPQISLLTLGQWWPWLGYLPGAKFAQERLHRLASLPHLTWVDISSVTDGCSFSFVDPIVTLQNPPSPCTHPKLVSARWHTLFSKEAYRQLRKNPFRLHMQYLYASPKLGTCDYFAITAGPMSLAERFANVPAVV